MLLSWRKEGDGGMGKFIRNICVLAFSLYAGYVSWIGTEVILEETEYLNKFEGMGIIIGIIVLAFVGNGLKEFLEDLDKKKR